MASEPLKKGEYAPAAQGDTRSPCPFMNSLANHGLVSRNGRGITADELKSALRSCGVGLDVAIFLSNTSFSVHADQDNPSNRSEGNHLGLRDKEDVNDNGVPTLDLNRLSRPNAMEHDVSLSRQDRRLGGPTAASKELVEDLMNCPADGKTFTSTDFINYRKKRYNDSKRDNPQLNFTEESQFIACAEVAALLGIFGKGYTSAIPKPYLQALFEEERLPYKEGWSPRWTPMTIAEVYVWLRIISYNTSPF